MKPKVSVIIPSYNSAPFIKETIDSVFAQTYRDFEIIVVDDGSKDNTAEVVNSFGDRVRFIPKPNGGPASARNVGIKAAQGDFLAFLDSDDLWLPRKLELQMQIMESDPAIGLVACSEQEVSQDDKKFLGTTLYRNTDRKSFIKNMLLGNRVGGGSSSLVRRECFDRIGLFNENLRGTEDWDMWLRIALVYEVRFVEEVLMLARIRPDSVSSVGNVERMLEHEIKLLDHLFAEPGRRFSPVQKRKSYAFRYFAAAKTYKNSGHLREAGRLMRKSLSMYLPLLFRAEVVKVVLMIVWLNLKGKKS